MKNAPLAEIIAEVRWAEARIGQPTAISFGGNDGFYVKLGIALGRLNYDRLERVLPEGLPVQGGNIVYRYRNDAEPQNTLYQAGFGVFTANGLPPYSSWSEFEQVVRSGVEVFLGVMTDQKIGPIELVLRYVDAFTETHLAGMSMQEFASRVAGVHYEPTSATLDFVGNAQANIRFSAVHQASSGQKAMLEIGSAKKGEVEAIIINTIAASPQMDDFDADTIMSGFGTLQAVLHETFDQMLDRAPDLKARLQDGDS